VDCSSQSQSQGRYGQIPPGVLGTEGEWEGLGDEEKVTEDEEKVTEDEELVGVSIWESDVSGHPLLQPHHPTWNVNRPEQHRLD